MGLLSRNLGFWARCAAATVALSALAPAAMAGSAAKPAPHHGQGATGKRAALGEKKVERARTGKNLPAAWTTPARDPKIFATKPVAVTTKDDKASPKDANKASPKDSVKPGVKVVGKVGDKASSKIVAKKEPSVPASSVGSPNEGHLVGGVKLDTSDGTVRVVPAYQRGDTRWGLPALIHMIERSAKKVAKKNPGSVLGVGDISRKNGGDIFLHRSHESGRDADIAFYVVDHKGKNLLPDTFVQFQGSVESTSMPGARFDVARNWALVQAMLEDPQAHVSHIFVADPLRRMLLAHAKSRVSPALYNRAAQVMMQPSNALPHDNHFHVRISCPAEMRKSCVEYPVGVFAKTKKGKPSLITPHKHGADKAVARADKASPKGADKASPKATPQLHAAAAKPVSKPVAQKVAKAVTPKAAPKPEKVASAEPKKKPIYLQAAAANNDDPLDTVLFSVPALSHLNGADPDGDADGEDVKASVDETGTVKITE
ncbi:MAG: penicillin-insensitive murein endopeptidase [Polyangiaceae bacterium]